MFIDKNSLVINNVNMGEYLTQIDYQYPKLWGDDTGRNLAGSFSGTLLGVFSKIVLYFRKLSREELEIIAPILDSDFQTLTYYDPVKKQNTTITTYTGDWTLTNKRINGNEPFSISFVATKARN